MSLTWSDYFSVGVTKIDNQHKELINTLNELNDAMRNRQGKEVLETILSKLTDYTVEHFSTEEELMEKFNFEHLKAHKDEHIQFVNKVTEFIEGFKEGRLMLSIDIMNFLSDWVKNHILGSDKKYVECFKENGLT